MHFLEPANIGVSQSGFGGDFMCGGGIEGTGVTPQYKRLFSSQSTSMVTFVVNDRLNGSRFGEGPLNLVTSHFSQFLH
jgi:hypothetical protein